MDDHKLDLTEMRKDLLDASVKSVDEKTRTVKFVGSDETVDRYGDVIKADGWDLKAYKKNPVFLWGHKSGEPPIGRAKSVKINGKKLEFEIEFAEKGTYPFADTIFNLYHKGFLKATSVGFLPKKAEDRYKKDEDGDKVWVGYKFLEQELLELSAVSVPANPNALMMAYTKGLIPESLMKDFEINPDDSKNTPPMTEERVRELFDEKIKEVGESGGFVVGETIETGAEIKSFDELIELTKETNELLKSLVTARPAGDEPEVEDKVGNEEIEKLLGVANSITKGNKNG